MTRPPSGDATPIEVVEAPAPVPGRKAGFLPIETNWFDRIFISVVIWVAVSLFWFRLIEPLGLSIWISNVLVLGLAVFIVRKG